MGVYIVDFEGFRVNGRLVIKELCVMNILQPIIDLQHVMLHLDAIPFTSKDLKTASYLTRYHHGLPLITPYDQFTIPYIANGSTILMTGGLEKQETIKNLYPTCFVHDLYLSAKPIEYSTCKFFTHTTCAYAKCISIYKQLNLF